MSDSKLKQAPKVETKKMFQKRAKAWNIVNDEDDYQSEQEVNAKNGQNNLKYDDIDDSDTEDVFEL